VFEKHNDNFINFSRKETINKKKTEMLTIVTKHFLRKLDDKF